MHLIKTPLPSSRQIKEELPLSFEAELFIEEARLQCRQIVEGKSPLLAVIVGPCSIHDIDAAMEYALRLKDLSGKVNHSFFLIMRLFIEKPRTGLGWKGLLYDPYLDGSGNIAEGIRKSRRALLEMTKCKIPCATELLEPLMSDYFSDLISWGGVGARTSASPLHRQMASGLSFPVGFKNNIYGEVEAAIGGALASRAPHIYPGLDEEGRICKIETNGNPWTHIVLRGSEKKPNFDPPSVASVLRKLKVQGLPERLLIDCSHGNSGKKASNQKIAFERVIAQILEGNHSIFGLMLESHLFGGRQPLTANPEKLRYGVSITDPCLSWEETAELLFWADEEISRSNLMSSLQK